MKDAIYCIIKQEKGSAFLFAPFFIALGVIFYFAQVNTQPNSVLVFFVAAFFLLCTFLHTKYQSFLLVVVSLFCLGFLSAKARFILTKTKNLQRPQCVKNAHATVLDITEKDNYKKLLIKNNIGKIKITARTKVDGRIKIGDIIELSLCMQPVSAKVTPYGYDFAKFASFDGIVANGFSTSGVKIIESSKVKDPFLKIREKIYKKLQLNMPKDLAEVSAALLIGKKDGIKKEILESFKKSGTSHILAISGLHLTLVTLIVLSFARSFLCFFESFALKYNTKKIAAFFAIICAFCYLQIAGAPVSAKRAFIMAFLMLSAVILDKKTCIMRSLSVAATFIIVIWPENIFKPGFQMSFFAVLGICSSFSKSFESNAKDVYFLKKFLKNILGTASTSLIATVATLPFCIYHFQYVSLAGIFANIIAIPITTFFVMPSLILVVILMPINDFWLVYKSLELSLDLLIKFNKIAQNVGGIHFHGFPDYALLVIAFGLLVLFFLKTKIRYIGFIPILIGILCANNYSCPDIFISHNQIAINKKTQELHFLNAKRVPKNFVAKSWASHCKIKDSKIFKFDAIKQIESHAQEGTRSYEKNGIKVAFIKDEFIGKCSDYNLIIAYNSRKKSGCKNYLNRHDINKKGVIFVWIKNGKILTTSSKN